MDDPWDVKSVKKPGQYTSCMKLNGVPLLPPVLSKECRSEMQYYKLLAKEVEKRISILQPYVDDCDSNEDKTEASEIVDCIENDDGDDADQDTSHNIRKITDLEMDTETMNSTPHSNFYNYDSSVNINETCPNENANPTSQVLDVPERDYNCMKPIDLTDVDLKLTKCKQQKDAILEEILNLDYSISKDKSMESYFNDTLSQGCPPSISSKSFTGSLHNIHVQSDDSENIKTLVRQHSYTILTPSPQLLAHLEVQSLNLGVEMSSISMSESLTNLGSPGKKRRSWDIESAKAKWSNMAMELKQKNLSKPYPKRPLLRANTQSSASPSRAKCVAAARTKYSTLSLKQVTKTEIVPRNRPCSPQHSRPTSPVRVRNVSPLRDTLSTETITLEPQLTTNTKDSKFHNSMKESTSPQILNTKKGSQNLSKSGKDHKTVNQNHSTKSGPPKQGPPVMPNHLLISESDDPATKVRELYEKIQHQQQIQMSNLMEKQKREQLLLQQAFEEQNSLLFKQLKTICPKSPEKVKEAWGDKYEEADRGPVSLSQLISPRALEHSPVTSTLTDSNIYINHCNDVLKKSRNITDNMRYLVKSSNQNSKASSKINLEGSRTRTNSPTSPIRKNTPTSRRLNYDTSVSDKDYDQMLTDRTNDTLADLNVTFPSDTEDSHIYQKGPEVTVIHKTVPMRSGDSTVKCVEQTAQKSITSSGSKQGRKVVSCQPTPRQQAAATKIVALAKGFLVRRLMQTARVQATVQTIKDALLCALQLHQDREGIRGADVDLHRRLIQQITAACYSLHDTFIASSARERCAVLAADRSRRSSLAARPPAPRQRHSDIMSQSHSGAFPPRQKRLSAPAAAPALMTQSSYETYSEKGRARYLPSPRRRPWR